MTDNEKLQLDREYDKKYIYPVMLGWFLAIVVEKKDIKDTWNSLLEASLPSRFSCPELKLLTDEWPDVYDIIAKLCDRRCMRVFQSEAFKSEAYKYAYPTPCSDDESKQTGEK